MIDGDEWGVGSCRRERLSQESPVLGFFTGAFYVVFSFGKQASAAQQTEVVLRWLQIFRRSRC